MYHHGYRSQVKSWPTNPLHVIADQLRHHPRWVIGDFGCGDAELARLLPQNKVHSFDLVAANDTVVACDMKRVPLKAATLDAAVYCLSLMGTNVRVRACVRACSPAAKQLNCSALAAHHANLFSMLACAVFELVLALALPHFFRATCGGCEH